MSTQPEKTIPVVLIGVHRNVAVAGAMIFENTPYYLAAILDLTETPKSYQYSPKNLGTVLHALFPRAQALITGTAISDSDLAQVEPVWEEYANGMLRTETDGRSRWVALSKWHATPNGPPPPGWDTELLRQLDVAFK